MGKIFQSGEVPLLEVRMSKWFLVLGAVKAVLLGTLIALLIHSGVFEPVAPSKYGPIVGLILSNLIFIGIYKKHSSLRLIVTSRRIIREERTLFGPTKLRSLFWQEVAKIKSLWPATFGRLLGVGSIVFIPSSSSLGDIVFSFVDDLESMVIFFEEIIYLLKVKQVSEEEMIKFVKQFKQS